MLCYWGSWVWGAAQDGVEDARKLKGIQPQVGIIVLNDNRNYLAPAIKAGVAGLLTGNISRSEFIAAIRIIYLWRLVLFDGGANFA